MLSKNRKGITNAVNIDGISVERNMEAERYERKKERQRSKSFNNCKYCGDLVTQENYYLYNMCNKKECIRELLEFCDEECLTCPYPDCILYMKHVDRKKYFESFGMKYDEYDFKKHSERF